MLLSYIYLILLRHVSVVYGHHQGYVSSVKIVSPYALFCVTQLYPMLIFEIICYKIISSSLKGTFKELTQIR
jgi:hypothetical protein